MVSDDEKSKGDASKSSLGDKSNTSSQTHIQDSDAQSKERKRIMDHNSLQYILDMTTTLQKPIDHKLEEGFKRKLKTLFQLDKQKFKYFSTLLEKGNITQPSTLVNVFGGDMESLLIKIMGLEPSYFLYDMIALTEKLIIFSRLELKLEINTKPIKASHWLQVMKDDSYNAQFMEYQKSDFNKMKSISETGNLHLPCIHPFPQCRHC